MASAAPTPSAMPISPPISDSVTASTRNWPRMSRVRAPTAMRRPISRVRSVTDTSMMFMMPMPPTTQRHRGDRGEQQREHAARGFLRRRDLLPGCAARSRRPAPGCRRWRWRSSARTCPRPIFMSSPSAHLDPDRADAARLRAALAAPSTRLRAVLIGIRTRSSWSRAHQALALGLEHADHGEGHALDADRPGRPGRRRRTAASPPSAPIRQTLAAPAIVGRRRRCARRPAATGARRGSRA